MIFDLLRKIRSRSDAKDRAESSDSRSFADDPDSLDSTNSFPDPVIIPFRDVLDLHSIPPRQVRAVVEDYIEEVCARRVRFVRIIHGKGIGVQREIIRDILSRTALVVDFRDAPSEAGGWGATVVTLSVDNPPKETRSND